MLDMIFQFMGYTFAFWMAWKVFDGIYHRLKGDVGSCYPCGKKGLEIIRLNALVKRLTREKKEMESTNSFQEKDEIIAIKILNVAGQGTIEDIYGIGPMKAKRLVEARPFYSYKDVEKVVPGFRSTIIAWAKRWERSFSQVH